MRPISLLDRELKALNNICGGLHNDATPRMKPIKEIHQLARVRRFLVQSDTHPHHFCLEEDDRGRELGAHDSELSECLLVCERVNVFVCVCARVCVCYACMHMWQATCDGDDCGCAGRSDCDSDGNRY